MKKCIAVMAGLMMAAWQTPAFGQTVFPTEPGLALAQLGGEGNLEEREVAKMSFDALLSDAGYVVYPIEQDCATLERKIAKNPMVLRKDFIPRRVTLIRRVGPGTEGRMSGREFAVVAEIGSAHQFMVDVKDLHFLQGRNVKSAADSQ